MDPSECYDEEYWNYMDQVSLSNVTLFFETLDDP